MGFFSRLFGTRESEVDADKLARARQHLDEGEPNLAAAIVERIGGPEADEIRRRARDLVDQIDARQGIEPTPSLGPDADDPLRGDDPPPPRPRDPYRDAGKEGKSKQPKPPKPAAPPPGGMQIQFGADGSTTILSGDTAVTLNAPISDDDGRPRSTDAVEVARRVLAATGATELDARAFAFVEACVVLSRANELGPALDEPRGRAAEPAPQSRGTAQLATLADPRRRAVAELAVAAQSRDPARIAALVRAAAASGPTELADDVAWFATPLALGFAAHELGALAREGLVKPSWMLVEVLAKTEPEICAELVAKSGDPLFAGEALLFGDIPGLVWSDWRQVTAHPDEWRGLEIRRLVARGDLDAALALEQVHADECGPHYSATFDLARALGKLDPNSAITKVASLDPIVDNAGWLTGLARAGVGHDVVDRWIDTLGPRTYDPFGHFAETLAACIALGDATRARRCIAAGGPTGWQIACAAHDPLAMLATAADRASLLAVCYERVAPGAVAGRAISHGMFPLGAGKMVMQPAWLAFTDPHPIETLALVAALGPDTPRWPNLR